MHRTLLFALVALSGAQEAYGTGAFIHMIYVRLTRTMGGHPYQVMDDAMPGVSNIVQISSTRSQWCYDVHAGWDQSLDESVCTYTAIPPGNRCTVYVHVVLLLEETVYFPGRFDSRFESNRVQSNRIDSNRVEANRLDSNQIQ